VGDGKTAVSCGWWIIGRWLYPVVEWVTAMWSGVDGLALLQTDADYVDVIHSNGDSLIIGGLGAWEPIGRLLHITPLMYIHTILYI
jgi:hypothetical protein